MSSHRLAGREFLRLSEQQFEELRSYLLQPCGREHKLYAWLGETPGGLTLWRLRVPGEDDYRIRSEGAVEFTMDFIIREALEYEVSAAAGIMDVHSHPFQARAQFSRIDDEFVPRTQRAFERRNPFGTFCRFVTGQDENGFSLQLYDSILDSWNQIDALHVVGPGGTRVIRSHLASCESPDSEKQSAPEEIYQRNEIVRTPAENEGLRQARVMVVGAGGIGWEIARGLAALGVRDLTLVDADVIERANLNRLIEATPRHADRNVPKVRLLSRILRRHDPHRIVTPLEERFPGDEPRALLPNADLVIVGVDDARARHDVLRLCVRHHVPAIDCGTSITMNLDRTRERERNGHVWLYAPGEACWTEMGLTGSELWSDSLRSAQERAGYVLGDPNQSPGSIQSTNKIVAEIAVSLAEAHLVGRRPQYNLFLLRQTTEPEYDLGLKTLRVSRDSGCPLCGDGSFEGMGGDPFVQLEPADTWVPPLDAEDVAPFDPVALRQPADRRPTGVAIE